MKFFGLFIFFALAPTCVFSQVVELDLISVEGEKTSEFKDNQGLFSSKTVEEGELTKLAPSSLDDILKTTTLTTTTGGPRSSAEAPQIRGLSSNRIFLYIDGARQSFRTDHTSVLAIDPADLKEVEIYKSPVSTLKGNSLGGGLILKTKDPSDYLKGRETFGGSITSSYESASNEKSLGAKAYSQEGKLGFLFSFKNSEAGNLKLSNKETLPNSSYKDNSFSSKITYRKNNSTGFKFKLDYYRREDPSPINPTLNPPSDLLELSGKNVSERTTIGGEYSYKNLNLNIYQTTQFLNKKRISDGEKENRIVETRGVSLSDRFDFNKNKLFYELEGYQDDLDGKRGNQKLESYPKGSSRSVSLSSKFIYKEIKDFEITLGGREDYASAFSTNKNLKKKERHHFSKSLGITHKLSQKLDLSLGFSEGYNSPKIQEIYADGLHHHGDGFFIADNYFIPNEKLKPESSEMVELGAKFQTQVLSHDDLLTLKFQYFENKVKDYIHLLKIDRAISDGENGTTQFVNIPNVHLYGDEISLEYLYKKVQLLLTYGQIRGRNLDDHLFIADLPADAFNFRLEYEALFNLSLGYMGEFVARQNRVNEETTERIDATPSYEVHSFYTKYNFSKGPLKGMGFLTRVENLMNKEYRKHGSNINETGINYKFQLNYKINI